MNASLVLIINGDTEETSLVPCCITGPSKWYGATQFGTKIVCAPQRENSI